MRSEPFPRSDPPPGGRVVELYFLGNQLAGRDVVEADAERPRTPVLTRRSIQVLRMLADGLTNEEIAKRLYLAPATVRKHVARLCRTLGASNRAHAVAIAFRKNLLLR